MEAGAKTAATKAGAERATATKAAAGKGEAPAPNLQERMEGVQGWMAEIDRKQGRLTYFGAAAFLIAILASGAALYFGLTAKSDNSDTRDDIDELSTKVDQAATRGHAEHRGHAADPQPDRSAAPVPDRSPPAEAGAGRCEHRHAAEPGGCRRECRRRGGRERRRHAWRGGHAWRGHDAWHHDQAVAAPSG